MYYESMLRSLGYTGDMEDMVREFQRFNGLRPDGVLGPRTERLLNNPHRCGMPDQIGTDNCRWNRKDVTWQASLQLQQMTTVAAAEIFNRACLQWNAVCGIRLQPASGINADIHAEAGRGRRDDFDGPGGVLAWSEMPCGRERQLQQRYDRDERWSNSMLLAVVCHEVGHAIGIPHIQAGNLMAPYYDPDITGPRDGDVAEAVRRYGQPAGPVDPVPGDPASGRAAVDIVIGNQRFVGTADLQIVE